MKQVETITWQPYPECKPDADGWHIVSIKKIVHYKVEETNVEFDKISEVPFVRLLWFDKINGSFVGSSEVYAFGMLPNPYNPEAKTFNFLTALELMKQGKRCKCLNTEAIYESKDGEFGGWSGGKNWHYYTLEQNEIESDWELADEQ